MGDLVEITTVPKQQSIFYKITSGSFSFQVKGPGNAGIGLSRTPSRHCHFWLVIGCQGCTWVNKSGKQVQSVRTPNILSPMEFRGFWIQWHYDMLCVGRDGSTEPFITCRDKTFHLKYITLAVVGDSTSALQWRMEMPPLQEQIKLKPVTGGFPQWIPADGQLPDGALIGGYEKEILYIIRAQHRGSLTPGKFVPSLGLGFISWGGAMHEKSDFEVLCGFDCVWMPCSNGRIPTGAVVAGYSEDEYNEQLYVGRALYNDHLIPGKVQPSHRTCYIPYDNREIAMHHYEILVIPHKNIHSGNPYFMYDIGINETPVQVVNVEEFDDNEIEMEGDFE